jgi:hypothetical protein
VRHAISLWPLRVASFTGGSSMRGYHRAGKPIIEEAGPIAR